MGGNICERLFWILFRSCTMLLLLLLGLLLLAVSKGHGAALLVPVKVWSGWVGLSMHHRRLYRLTGTGISVGRQQQQELWGGADGMGRAWRGNTRKVVEVQFKSCEIVQFGRERGSKRSAIEQTDRDEEPWNEGSLVIYLRLLLFLLLASLKWERTEPIFFCISSVVIQPAVELIQFPPYWHLFNWVTVTAKPGNH